MRDTFAVIGAGISGLSCARALRDAGASVTVYEKSRGLGGRLATRRSDAGAFDHGAQYVTARDPRFAAYLDHAAKSGHAGIWLPEGQDRSDVFHVGVPGMNGLVRPLADGLDIRFETRVSVIEADGRGFELRSENGAVFHADRVSVTAPGPQALDLLNHFGAPFDRLSEISYVPCVALMIGFDRSLGLPDMIRPETGPVGWAARNGSKPGREGETWSVHARADWSTTHLDDTPSSLIMPLREAFSNLHANGPNPVHAVVHRWRYALVDQPLGEPFLLTPNGRLGCAGDGLVAPRVEAAYLSGVELATALLNA